MERKEAIEVVKKNYPHVTESGSQFETALRTLIPELKESEDERIWIINYLNNRKLNSSIIEEKESLKKVIAWLERQGEQKPADKVEPKFKVGDWITNGINFTFQVISIEDNHYLRSDDYFIDIETVDKTFRLWTIKDAKDGDVLYSIDSNRPFIYKERNNYEQATAYCGLNIYGKFFVWGTKDCIITLSNYVPATKEQRDLLFSKMKEAGYEWDCEKKELKMIELK